MNWLTDLIYQFWSFFKDIAKSPFTRKNIGPEDGEDVIDTKPPVIEVPTPEPEQLPTNRERLYEIAKAALNPSHDVSPFDYADDEVGCVESFDYIHRLAFGYFINGTKNKPTLSTIEAFEIFKRSKAWQEVYGPMKGAVIISVTGTGNGTLSNGHIGICGIYGIMSNNSKTGNWEQNYTYQKWSDYYAKKGGFKSRYFIPV